MSDATLDATFIDPSDDSVVVGTLEWDDPEMNPSHTMEYAWRFIPEDTEAYEEMSGTVLVPVKPDVEGLDFEEAYTEGGITYDVYDVKRTEDSDRPLTSMLEDRGFEHHDPEKGMEAYLMELFDTHSLDVYRDDSSVLIVFQGGEPRLRTYTARIPEETLMRRIEPKETTLPEQDSEGEDFDSVPRFEGSAMRWLCPLLDVCFPSDHDKAWSESRTRPYQHLNTWYDEGNL